MCRLLIGSQEWDSSCADTQKQHEVECQFMPWKEFDVTRLNWEWQCKGELVQVRKAAECCCSFKGDWGVASWSCCQCRLSELELKLGKVDGTVAV